MLPGNVSSGAYTRDDGFGTRRVVEDPSLGRVEVLDVVPALATPDAEWAIRERVEQLRAIGSPLLVPVHRVDRTGDGLSVIGAAADGIPLCEVLAAMEFGTLALPADAVLELAAVTVRAVGAVHDALGTLPHGALNAAHVVFQRDGSVVVTDAVFGDALQRLELNREELWRRFSIAMPAAATTPRFDRRNDVTQLASVVVAILLRRTLLAHEYPRAIPDLAIAASAEYGGQSAGASKLRNWLQQALQLQARAPFSSAAEAAEAFLDVAAATRTTQGGAALLHAAIRRLLGEPEADPLPPAPRPVPRPPAVEVPPEPDASREPAQRGFSFLRSVLPHLRGN